MTWEKKKKIQQKTRGAYQASGGAPRAEKSDYPLGSENIWGIPHFVDFPVGQKNEKFRPLAINETYEHGLNRVKREER